MSKIFDVLIIGSGPTAYGVLAGTNIAQAVGIVSHGKGDGYFKDTLGDHSHAFRFGGGLDSWHGVSSLQLFKTHFPKELLLSLDFFCETYGENSDSINHLLNDGIYIPSKKVSSKSLVNLIKKRNCDFVVDEVVSIESVGLLTKLVCKNTALIAKKVIVCAGAIGTMELLVRSNLGTKKTSIGNHINGYCKYNVKTSRQDREVFRGVNGHIKKVETGSVNDKMFIIYPRPSTLDFRNSKNLEKYKSTYSRKEKEVYTRVLKSFSPGLLIEAVYNRYGYWLAGDFANNYFQIESEGVYELNDENKVEVNSNKLSKVIDDLRSDNRFADVTIDSIVSGIHFYNTLIPEDSVGKVSNQKDWRKSILIADSSVLTSIGGAHHTFSLMAMNYLVMSKNDE
jgi:hypothetical protein